MLSEVHDELLHHQIAEHPHLVFVSDDIVPTAHQRLVHSIHITERPLAVVDDRTTGVRHAPTHTGAAKTPTREPVKHQRQDTATVQGVRPAAGESQPLPTK